MAGSDPPPAPAAAPVLLGGAVPTAGTNTGLAVPPVDWWEDWWRPEKCTVDTAALKAIFGANFAPSTTLRQYIVASGKTPAVTWAAFQLKPSVNRKVPDVFADLTDAGWLLGAEIPLQPRDPTYALGVLLENATLKDMGRKCIPIKALFLRIPDADAQSMATFRTANIADVPGVKSNAPPNKSVTTDAAKAASAAATKAAANAAKNPDDPNAQAASKDAAYLSQNAQDNSAVAGQSAATVDASNAANKAVKTAAAANKKKPTDATQAALDQATADAAAATAALNAAANQNLIGGWMFMGSFKDKEAAPPDSADTPTKRMYWAEKAFFREGNWDAINSYDGTFTYGAGWNMTSGEGGGLLVGLTRPETVKLAKPQADDPAYVASFVAGCANVCTYLKKCGIWFDSTSITSAGMSQNKIRLVHMDTSGATPVGYVVDNSQLCRKPDLGIGGVPTIMGAAYKYLALNLQLIDALVCVGSQASLPGEPTVPDGTRMASNIVMRTIQLRMFEKNRMANFTLWPVCATQALFFLLVHANHFGQVYRPDTIIQFGISAKLVPFTAGDASPGAGYVKVSQGVWLLPTPATDVKIARAAMTYMTTLHYKSKKTKSVNYDGGSSGYSVAAFFDLWSAFVSDITKCTFGATLGESPYAPPAAASSPSVPPPSTPGGAPPAPASSPTGAAPASTPAPAGPFPTPLDPTTPEPLPLQPWRQWLEMRLPATPPAPPAKPPTVDDIASGDAADWIIQRGRNASGWDNVHYVVIPKASAP